MVHIEKIYKTNYCRNQDPNKERFDLPEFPLRTIIIKLIQIKIIINVN